MSGIPGYRQPLAKPAKFDGLTGKECACPGRFQKPRREFRGAVVLTWCETCGGYVTRDRTGDPEPTEDENGNPIEGGKKR